MLFEKKKLIDKSHSSLIFVYVGIMYCMFWDDSSVESKSSYVVFLVVLICFVCLLLTENETVVRVAYLVVAAYTVTELWNLGTVWCCNGQKSMPTYFIVCG